MHDHAADAESHNKCRQDQEFRHVPYEPVIAFFLDAAPFLAVGKAQGEHGTDQQFGNYQCGEHGQRNTDGQVDGEALDGAGAQDHDDERGDDGGHVAVDDGGSGLVKAEVQRLAQRNAVGQFLGDTGIDNDVGVHGHTDGQDDTGYAGKSQGDLEQSQKEQHQCRIEDQRKCSDDTGDKIHHHHEDHDGCKTDGAADEGGSQSLLAQLCAHNVGTDLIELQFQAADTDVGCDLSGFFQRAHALDDGIAVIDDRIDTGNGDETSVIVDTDGLIVAVCRLSGSGELLCAFLGEGQFDHSLLQSGASLLHNAGSVGNIRAFTDDGPVCAQFFDALVQFILTALGTHGIVLCAVGAHLCDEVQAAGCGQTFQDLVGIGDAGDLNGDSVVAFQVDIGLSGILIDTLLQFVAGIAQIAGGGVFHVRLIGDGHAAFQIQAFFDVGSCALVFRAPAECCGIDAKCGDQQKYNDHGYRRSFTHLFQDPTSSITISPLPEGADCVWFGMKTGLGFPISCQFDIVS